MSKLTEICKSRKAPLVETDINELGDKRLDPKEGVAQQREKCLAQASQYRIEDQDELADAGRMYGARLGYAALLSRLQKLAPGLQARDGAPGQLALYFPRKEKELDAAIREGSGGSGDLFFLMHKYVGGFPKEELPEWGYVDIDTSLIATREHSRGWRTVLIGLMHCSVISYQDAIEEFGDPAKDPRGHIWLKKTKEWRQNPLQKFTLREYVEAQKA